ncbi:MAG TPA: zinc-dependent metalloprotease [Pyrinomonadaceae bacterium]
MPRIILFVLLALVLSFSQTAFSQDEESFDKKTGKLQKIDGFMPLYWDARNGKMFLEISRFNREFLYQVSLPAGLGSNPVGLDRGQLGRTFVVYFERAGNKVLLVQPNYRYRALTTDEAERKAVADSFARSVIFGFQVAAEKDDKVLVDATAFLLRDAHGVVESLKRAKQGNYRVDDSRSAFYLERTRGFPKNTEIETTLTFAGDEPGRLVGSVTPTANSVTVREHHSFVELPDDNYKPRKFDPRVNSFGITFYDYASPFTEAIEKRWIARHRLEKRDPEKAVSEVVKPIVYYVDPGAPEPIRSALVEGASWWNQAFEAAGFKDAFQVKVLPAGADPMDVRYNMINWVHRSTRGWSYGASVTDPRTGEIIKGNVSLGSLRIRQDFMLGTGIIPAFGASTNENGFCMFGDSPELSYLATTENDSAEMSLARIRQLAAHEVGHTLGFAHNFAASSYGRGSVMDYPAPAVEIKNGKLDLSNAYAVGIGAFDKYAVKFAYSQFLSGADVTAELEKIIAQGQRDGMLYISDSDARGMNTAHPLASIWDNGTDMVAYLRHEMQVRRIGLAQFGLSSIPKGTPLSELEARLIPLYLHHRYQLVSALKSVGGMYFTYAVRTDTGISPNKYREIVAPERQREALNAILDTIKPEELAFPDNILKLLPPRADGFDDGTGEYFQKRTDPVFDSIGAATIASDLAISGLLEPSRAARMIEFNAGDKKYPHFKETVDALVLRIWKAPKPANNYHAAILAAEQNLLVQRLMDLTANADASPQVRAVSNEALYGLNESLKIQLRTVPDAYRRLIQQDVERFLTRPDAPRQRTPVLPVPPGEPIGN